MTDLAHAVKTLTDGHFTCVVCRGEQLYTTTARGVKPLVSWYDQRLDLTDFSAADRVVGRATAFLYVLHGVRAVHAKVISREARQVLLAHGIQVSFETLVDRIVNRTRDGLCPFESAVLSVTDVHEAERRIRQTMCELHISL